MRTLGRHNSPASKKTRCICRSSSCARSRKPASANHRRCGMAGNLLAHAARPHGHHRRARRQGQRRYRTRMHGSRNRCRHRGGGTMTHFTLCHRSAGPAGQQTSGHDRTQSRWRSGCGRQRRPCTRAHSGSRRHRTAAGRLIAVGILPSRTACLAPLRAGAGFGPARMAGARERPDHRYSRGPFHETVH